MLICTTYIQVPTEGRIGWKFLGARITDRLSTDLTHSTRAARAPNP